MSDKPKPDTEFKVMGIAYILTGIVMLSPIWLPILLILIAIL